jgi:hypothetical protein
MESRKIYDGSCTKQAKHMMEIAQNKYQAKQTM